MNTFTAIAWDSLLETGSRNPNPKPPQSPVRLHPHPPPASNSGCVGDSKGGDLEVVANGAAHGNLENGVVGKEKTGKSVAVKVESDAELDDFLDFQESMSTASNSDMDEHSWKPSTPSSALCEYYDAFEEISSDGGSRSSLRNDEDELREIRLKLLMEIEKMKQAEGALGNLRSQWQSLSQHLLLVGLTLPALPAVTDETSEQPNSDPPEDLCRQVVLGGFTALMTAAGLPQQVVGLALLNSAGQFGNPDSQPNNDDGETAINKFIVKPLKEVFQRIVLGFLFWQAKQPARVESVLKSVYINTSNVDDYLVESIIKPASDPNAGEVYYRLMSRFMSNQTKYTLDSLLSKLSCPLLLLWGDLDPWVGPAKAARIKEFYRRATVVNLQAGHCPHDEVPELANRALLDWLSSLESESNLQALELLS